MKKRILAGLLVLGVSAAGLAGCGQAPDANNGTVDTSPPASMQTDGILETSSVAEVIKYGYSIKDFEDGEVREENIETILEAGAKAPSARNLQPWKFTVVRNYEIASSLVQDTPEGGVLIIVSAVTEPEVGSVPVFDAGLATQNMYITAQSLGLGVHIYGSPLDKINGEMREQLGIPEGHDAVTVLLIGHINTKVSTIASASKRNALTDMVNYVD